MSYGLIYTIPFAAHDNTSCVVEIEKEGYTGVSTELTAGETPFTVSIEDEEFLYTPTRFSTAQISVVGGDYLQELFSTQYLQYRVTLLYGGSVAWCGFIKPEVYTQDYSSSLFSLEIECQSAMSVLEYIDYKTRGSEKTFVSLWDLIQQCLSAVSPRYSSVYIPYVYASSKPAYEAGTENVLQQMTVSEQNFFDEDGEPMSLLEVLEEVCKLLNWTCSDWAGSLYFVDIDHAGTYHRYNAALTTKTDDVPSTQSVQSLGFMGTGHSLDILGGYNKVTVKCSNYPVGERSWSMDFDDLPQLASSDSENGDRRSHLAFLDFTHVETKAYTLSGGSFVPVTEAPPPMLGSFESYFGALPVKYCEYEEENGEANITEYSYTPAIRVRHAGNNSADAVRLDASLPVFVLHLPCAAYQGGVLAINGKYKRNKDTGLSTLADYQTSDNADYKNFSKTFQMRIGEQWYNGSGWQTTECSFDVEIEVEQGEEFNSIKNQKKLTDPYDGAVGYLVNIPAFIKGELELRLLAKHLWADDPDIPEGLAMQAREVGGYWQDLSIGFYRSNTYGASDGNEDSDRVYENVINEDFINELDEIEMKISSYNNDGACYSKVMLNGSFLTDNLYNSLLGKAKRPEELLITRIINYYAAPRVKLTQPLRYTSGETVSPLTRLTDNYQPGKVFLCMGGEIDYRMNRFDCQMIEL